MSALRTGPDHISGKTQRNGIVSRFCRARFDPRGLAGEWAMVQRSHHALAAIVAALAAPAAHASVVISQGGSMDVGAEACLSASGDFQCNRNEDSDGFVGDPTALGANASARIGGGDVSASMAIDVRSSWDSADHGTADINAIGSLYQTAGNISASYNSYIGSNWSYHFATTQDTILKISADLYRTSQGVSYGTRDLEVYIYGSDYLYTHRYSQSFDDEQFELAAGNSYYIYIYRFFGDQVDAHYMRDTNELVTTHFTFDLTAAPTPPTPPAPPEGAVPEPGTWEMAVAGFGLIGGAIRRRKRSVAVPWLSQESGGGRVQAA